MGSLRRQAGRVPRGKADKRGCSGLSWGAKSPAESLDEGEKEGGSLRRQAGREYREERRTKRLFGAELGRSPQPSLDTMTDGEGVRG